MNAPLVMSQHDRKTVKEMVLYLTDNIRGSLTTETYKTKLNPVEIQRNSTSSLSLVSFLHGFSISPTPHKEARFQHMNFWSLSNIQIMGEKKQVENSRNSTN